MTLSVWTKPSGFTFGTFHERSPINYELPVSSTQGITFTVISGALPGGLRVKGNYIVGFPTAVLNLTKYTFCIRASDGTDFSDRTFNMYINGPMAPVFVTNTGLLPIGQYGQHFVLDNTYVNFKIEIRDIDVAIGVKLNFYITPDSGTLPDGLTLTSDGYITGFVGPVIPENSVNLIAYRLFPFSVSVSDGLSIINRNFSIIVVGDNYLGADNNAQTNDTLIFSADVSRDRPPIWSTPSDLGSYRADNYITLIPRAYNNNVTYVLSTVNSDIIATTLQSSSVDNRVGSNKLSITNASATPKVGQYLILANLGKSINITDGFGDGTTVTINVSNGAVYAPGSVFQITNAYPTNFNGLFIITESNTSYIKFLSPIYGKLDLVASIPQGIVSIIHQINNVVSLNDTDYRLFLTDTLEVTIPDNQQFYIGSLSETPQGTRFNEYSATISGIVPYQVDIYKDYNFTMIAYTVAQKSSIASASRKFKVRILGSATSNISWVTDTDLGSINPSVISTLEVKATSVNADSVITYQISNGHLPPGLTLKFDGEIVGQVRQYATSDGFGMTTFSDTDGSTVYHYQTFDDATTTIDRTFVFGVEARDQYLDSAMLKGDWSSTIVYNLNDVVYYQGNYYKSLISLNISNPTNKDEWGSFLLSNPKTFKVKVTEANTAGFSSIIVKPLLPLDQRSIWRSFITDNTIFTPSLIYRPNDVNFGVRTDLSMLIYAGIETVDIAKYISALGLNVKEKTFKFGKLTKAIAKTTGSTTESYEVVYLEMIDPYDTAKKHLPEKISLTSRTNKITADSGIDIWQSGFQNHDPITVDEQKRINKLKTSAPDSTRPDPLVTVDSTGYAVSDFKSGLYFPNTVTNWRLRISRLGKTERNYMPLWMRSIQPGDITELDFVLAVPICFCKVGAADKLISNIKSNGFDFSIIDYTIDRFIINAVANDSEDKYLIFKNIVNTL